MMIGGDPLQILDIATAYHPPIMSSLRKWNKYLYTWQTNSHRSLSAWGVFCISPESPLAASRCHASTIKLKEYNTIFWNMPQNLSLKSNSYTDHCSTTAFCCTMFNYFEISATRSAFREGCACAHCVLQPAGQLTL